MAKYTDEPARFIVELPAKVARELDAFCQHHFDASRAAVVRRAISALIESEMEKDEAFRKKIHVLRDKVAAQKRFVVK